MERQELDNSGICHGNKEHLAVPSRKSANLSGDQA